MVHGEAAPTQMQYPLGTDVLEIAYQKSYQDVAIVYADERERRVRVQKMLLEHDNEDLGAELRQSQERVENLTLHEIELQESIDSLTVDRDAAQGDIRIRTREIDTLKAELESLQGITMDSTKLLTEKLALSRELSSLKPEVNYLRSQSASHQSLLAEKLSLERHVSTLQVELENEKRSSKRITANDQKQREAEAKSESQIERLQADLNRERKERQRVEREAQKASDESERNTTALESRVEAIGAKLKSTKDALKGTQLALQNTRLQHHRRASPEDNASRRIVPDQARKREAARIDEDTMLGTPGDLPKPKRGRNASTMVGEKSTFSITPFLNRTASVAPESPPSSRPYGTDGRAASDAHRPGHPLDSNLAGDTVGEHATDGDEVANKPERAWLGSTEHGKRSNPKPQAAKKSKGAPRLEQVLEEDNRLNSNSAASDGQMSEGAADDTTIGGTQAKRMRRKLLGGGLGKTLFEDDANDAQTDRGHWGAVKGFGAMSGRRVVGPKLASRTNGFGAISPLKRDRRVGAV